MRRISARQELRKNTASRSIDSQEQLQRLLRFSNEFIRVLNRQLYFTNPFTYAIIYAQYVGSYSEPLIQFSFLSAYIYEIIKLLLFYFGVYYITRTKLNLE